jgi:hypothetical protein
MGKEVVMVTAFETLVILAWNVFIGNKAASVRRALRAFIKEHKPDVIALMEASNLYGELDTLGYTVVQLKPKPLRAGNQPGQGNIALLISPDYSIKYRGRLDMKTFWLGPKHGWPQDPRVYRYVLIKKKGDKTARTWKVGVAHTPFGGEARAESRISLVKWFKDTNPGRPTVLVLDANMGIHEFETSIAKPGGADASGFGIDLEAHKNCKLVDEDNLGKGISDHPAVKRKYAARRRDA